jgi:hypothetical protein
MWLLKLPLSPSGAREGGGREWGVHEWGVQKRISSPNRRHKLKNLFSILDAFEWPSLSVHGLHARAHVHGQRLTAWPYLRNPIAHVCRCESTTQDEVSVDVWRKQ